MRGGNAFQPNRLPNPCRSRIPDRVRLEPPVLLSSGLLEVERIITTRTHRRQKQYLIQWKHCPAEDATWLTAQARPGSTRILLLRMKHDEDITPKRGEGVRLSSLLVFFFFSFALPLFPCSLLSLLYHTLIAKLTLPHLVTHHKLS